MANSATDTDTPHKVLPIEALTPDMTSAQVREYLQREDSITAAERAGLLTKIEKETALALLMHWTSRDASASDWVGPYMNQKQLRGLMTKMDVVGLTDEARRIQDHLDMLAIMACATQATLQIYTKTIRRMGIALLCSIGCIAILIGTTVWHITP